MAFDCVTLMLSPLNVSICTFVILCFVILCLYCFLSIVFYYLVFLALLLPASLVFYLHHSCHLPSEKSFVNLPFIQFPHPVIFIWTSLCFITFSLNHPCLYVSKYAYNLSLYPSIPSFFPLHFGVLHFSVFATVAPFHYPVFFWFFLPRHSLPSPFFHLCPASTNERCHGPIDTGWSVCSQH